MTSTGQAPTGPHEGSLATLAKRFGAFSIASLLSTLTPFVALPLIARTSSNESWTAFNVGTSVGTMVAAVSFVGWSAAGPPIAASASAADRIAIYDAALRMRALALVIAAPIACAASAALTWHGAPLTAALTCLGNTVGALSLSWFAIGAGTPRQLVRFETVPRLLASGLGIALILVSGAPAVYAPLLGAATLIGLAAFGRDLHAGTSQRASTTRHDLGGWFRRTRAAWLTEISGNVYSSAPLPIAAAFLPAASVATYASADKLYRWALIAVIVVGNSLQGWVLAPGWSVRRQRIGLMAHGVLGVLGGLTIALLGPAATRLLFGSDLAAPRPACVWLGIAYFAISSATPLLRTLILPASLTRALLAVTVPTALGGTALMIALAHPFGGAGVAAGLACSEVAVVVVATFVVLRRRREIQRRVGESPTT